MSDKRRMFSDSVLRSADFMFLSKEAQLLYIQLCMEADDRGAVNNAIVIVGMLSTTIGVKKKHLEELIQSGLVIKLRERLHIITDWNVQNQIQKDRFRESRYKEEIEQNLVQDETTKRYVLTSADVSRIPPVLDTNCIQNPSSSGYKNHPQYSIVEYSIDKDSIVENSTYNACACENKADPPDKLPDKQNDADCVCADDTSDSPDNMPHELTQKAEQLRQKLSESGLRVPDKISWLMREFRFALDGKRRLKLTDEEFFGGLENYAKLLALRKESPDVFWWSATPQIPSLFTGSSPQILRFLPAVFDIASFKKAGKARASPRRGIDSEYSLKAIAEGA